MDEREFNACADAMLARIEEALEACALDLDLELKPGGVLEVGFENGTRIIINRHGAAREIWLAAKSGGYHFKPDAGDPASWRSTRDGSQFFAVLSRCVSDQAGVQVELAPAR